ncbi:MAG: sigma-70 family RNA polymerase sigma factor [Deltaproteobacteria bacterium]|nr:sigma-70 family RNA polymerase sigma factor [Deltaproteobacteria bacterium]
MTPLHPVAGPNRELREALPAVLPALRARARRLARSAADAEDLVQDTALRALRFEARYQPGTNPRAFLQQVEERLFFSECRRRSRERRAHERAALERSLVAEPRQSEFLTPRVVAALAALPAPSRRVLLEVDVQGQSYRDAAVALGVPTGTVMSRLHRARRALARALADGERRPRAA